MQYKIFLSVSFILFFSFSQGCRLKKEGGTVNTFKPAIVAFLDSSAASQAILIDQEEGFFEVCSKVEMEIQMKSKVPFQNREEALSSFKMFLQREVSDWTTQEKTDIESLFRKVKKMCDSINPRIFPGDIKLIKVKTNHYGKDVYYTRGKHIMIPENIFPIIEENKQLPVMVHEVFHILSRYQPTLKSNLYREIGFEEVNKPVVFNDILTELRLSNPDGISTKYAMQMEQNGGDVLVIPMITSKYKHYKENLTGFFDYLNFDLYELHDKGTYYQVISDPQGKTTLPLQNTPSFFTKIKDNTQYIIHPDEIMADNFMLAVLAYNKGDYSRFSVEGRALIDIVLDQLKSM